MEQKVIGFIGFGLIAGDIARCIRKNQKDAVILAYNARYPMVKPGLTMSIEDGVVNQLVHDLSDFHDCDILFLCAPVIQNLAYIPKLKNILKPGCILTDVGSVKNTIHAVIHDNNMDACFIGGHPMAGSEKTGYENSTEDMLKDAFYLLTPTMETPMESIQVMQEITKMCGCKTMVISPEEHDIAAAAISHVPHILSYSLVNTVREHDNEQQYMKQFAGGGFRDMTRIAASSPEMWQNIVLSNKKSVLTFLSQYQIVLEEFKQMLIADDEKGLMDFFQESKDYRDTFQF